MSVTVVGAGMAGLACARALTAAGIPVTVVEGSDRPGGRVASDVVDGFTIDRGFQVLLDRYPEAGRQLDLGALGLRPFTAGALVRHGGRLARIADPWRDPWRAPATLFSGAFTVSDVTRLLRLRRDCAAWAGSEVPARLKGMAARALLQERGFSAQAMSRFFEPFFGGVFLDRALGSSAEFFAFVFRMFAIGRATLPARGMGAIAAQLADALPAGAVRTGARVASVEGSLVHLEDGTSIGADRIVLATDADAAARLLGQPVATSWSGCITLSYDAPAPPAALREPTLLLNGEGPADGPVNHVCIPSLVQPGYAPTGRTLVSVTLLDDAGDWSSALEGAARTQLARWFGGDVAAWRLIRADQVARSLPRQWPTAAARASAVRAGSHLYACGDWLEGPSIDAALRSGRRAAEAVLEDLGVRGTTRAA